MEFSPPLGVNYTIWPNISWCFTFFHILDFKHLTLQWQSCCVCSYMVLLNKFRFGWVSLKSLAPSLAEMLGLLPKELFQLRYRLKKISSDSDSTHFNLFWFLSQYYLNLSFSQLPMTSVGVQTEPCTWDAQHPICQVTIRHLRVVSF